MIKEKVNFEKTLNYLIVFLAFSISVSKAAVSATEILLILFWLLQGEFSRKWNQIKSNSFIIIIALFLVLSIIQVLNSTDISFALGYLKKYWHLLIIPIVLTSLNKEYIKKVFHSFLLGVFVSLIAFYGIFFGVLEAKYPAQGFTPFIDHTNYSIYLAFSCFISIFYIFKTESIKLKVLYIVLTLLTLSVLFINTGRTGQIAFFITIFIVFLSTFKNRLKGAIYIMLGVLVLFFSAYNISEKFKIRMNSSYNDIKAMINKESQYNGGISMRVALWTMGTNQFLDNTLLGTGIGDEAVGIGKYIDKYDFTYYKNNFNEKIKYIDFHNAYIQYAVQLGIVGLVLFLMLFISLVRTQIKNEFYRNLNISFVSLIMLLSIVGLSLHIMASMTLFALFSGTFLAISRIENKSMSI